MPDYDANRAEREFNMNPPAGAPGLSDEGWDNLFNDSNTSANSTDFSGVNAGVDVGGILNGQVGADGQGGMIPGAGMQGAGLPGAGMQQPQSTGSKVSALVDELAVKGAKGIGSYIKALFTSLTNNSKSDWHILGARMAKVSVGVFFLFLLFSFLKIFITSIRVPWELFVGSTIGTGVGVLLSLVFRKENKPVEPEEPAENFSEEQPEGTIDWDDSDFDEGDSWGEEEENDWGDAFGEDTLSDFGDIDDSSFASNEDFNAQEEVNKLADIPSGQYTRQFLFETFSKILPTIDPTFMSMENVTEGCDEFMMFEDFMRRSAEQTGINCDKLDELQLLEVRKNLFIIQLIATRPTGLKEKEIADGIADCYKRDDYGMIIQGREGVFSRVNSQVGKMIIDIFLCNNVMVSLGDIYRQKSEFVLNSNNIMPLVWGVSEMGSVFCYDGMKDGNGGILISGEARSGKSWKGQSLIAQMCMFMSPKELELYFYDVKGDASDYAYLSRVLPHCKGFCGESLQFNDSIEKLLTRERERRTALLSGKYTNVKDYNKEHPYEKIPTIYIVIDEMATAMSEMKDKDNEIRKKFDSLLIQIATKYPYLEIKLMLFPHRIVNDIINKTVSSMISTRSVMGNVPFEELKSALDVKKDFPYSLVKTGDMAIKTKSLNNGNVVYSHSEVLSTSEQVNRKIFDYIGAVWGKLEPDCKPRVIGSSNQKVKKSVKDTSLFSEDYSYSSKGNFSEAENLSDLSDVSNDVDESFWDELTSPNSKETGNEDAFWSDWGN